MFRRTPNLFSMFKQPPQRLLNLAFIIAMAYLVLTMDRRLQLTSSTDVSVTPVPITAPETVENAQPMKEEKSRTSTKARHERQLPGCARNGKRAKSFLMVFMGHSGSSAIISELRQHPAVQIEAPELVDHQEVFNTTEALQMTRDMFQRSIKAGKTPGFKIRPTHILNQPEEWKALAEEFDTRIIWQYRKNIFKSAVGEYTHRFLNDSSVVEGLRRNMTREERCKIGAGCQFAVTNFTFLHKNLRDMMTSQRLITAAVNAIAGDRGCVREVPYEDYLYARQDTLTDLWRFLGLEKVESKPERFKATGDNLCEVLSNWDEVCRNFYGCLVWQHMMDDPRNDCFCNYSHGPVGFCEL